MKTFPIAIVACGLIAAYISYPTQHKTPSRPLPVPTLQQKPIAPARSVGVYVTDSNGVLVSMKIRSLKTSVRITGTLAVTTVDMTVYNPHNRVLEGEFETPVMEGQTICRFALDINGKLREGVVVEKEKARAAFESVVRQKIDPALLEWTRGNTFKTRIYPIPAHGTRHVVVAFEQELVSGSEGYAYAFPFAFKELIDTFDFEADVASFGERPSLAGNDLEGVEFMSKGRSYVAEIHRTDVVVDKPFRCAIPVTSGKTFVSVNTFDNEQYFAAFIPVPTTEAERPAPRTITLLWDASLSARSRDINKELDLLDTYFKKIGNTRVTLVPFSIEPYTRRDFAITSGEWTSLRTALLNLPNDGATQLGALPLATIATDIALLVSDGLSTFGKHVPPRASRPLYAITSAAQSDHDVLRAIAEQSGGAFVNLVERSPDDALALLTAQQLSLMRIDIISGLVSETYPVGVVQSNMLTVGGKMKSADAELELQFGNGGRILETKSLRISARADRDTGTAVARLWAQSQLRKLGMDRIRNEAAIVDIGKKFTIVTPGTSLLVLDRIEDYVRYRIAPPKSEPDLHAQYISMLINERSDSIGAVRQRIEQVANMMQLRTSWYERAPIQKLRKFKKDGGTVTTATSTGAGGSGAAVGDEVVLGSVRYQEVPVSSLQSVPIQNGSLSADLALPPGVPRTNEVIRAQSLQIHQTGSTSQVSSARSYSALPSVSTTPQGFDAGVSSSTWAKTSLHDVELEGMDSKGGFSGCFGCSGSLITASMPSPYAVADSVADDDGREVNKRLRNDVRGIIGSTLNAPKRSTYLEKLSNAPTDKLYQEYLALREVQGTQPGFYVDASDILRDKGLKAEALRVLSNMAEIASEDPRLLRVLGQRLMQLGESEYAVLVFEDVKRMRGEEPQSYRDLGLACAQAKQYQRAVDNLYQVITRTWDGRFPEIELIAVNELNRVLRDGGSAVNQNSIDPRFVKPMPVDMRVVLSWDADDCDMDLWVIDPRGEKCFYSNRDTELGGHLSHDLTGGYGPEEFLLKKAPKGNYEFKVHYYGDSQQRLTGPTTVTVDVFTNYGTPKETKKSMTVRVDGVSRIVDIGSIAIN